MGKVREFIVISILVAAVSVCGCAHIKTKPTLDEQAAEDAYYHFSLADQAIMRGDLDEAISELKLALKYDPGSAALRVHLASIYLARGEVESARVLLEEALEYEPDNISAHRILGGLCLSQGKLECAESHYRAILKVEPTNRDAVRYLVFALNQQGRLDEALSVLESYADAEPDDLNAQFELVEIYISLGRNADALGVLNGIIEAHPRNTVALLARAALLEEMGRTDEAKQDYIRALMFAPRNLDARSQLIRLCLDIHDFECAKSQIEKFKESGAEPGMVELYEALYLFSTRSFDEAAKKFEKLCEQNPDDSYKALLLGLSLKNAQRFDRAMDVLGSIPADSPQRFDALIAMGEICAAKADRCALDYASEAREAKPNSYQPYLVEGSYYIEIGDHESARRVLEKAESISPDSHELLYSLGFMYDKMGMWELGLEKVRRILEDNPEDPDALNFIGYTYA
ncbi:MAG TPA: tetratricopeptide repeat protein, partial [Proteobacteria bacterium]|nr:tetratricopeptide repeat protein [Pseudomonadota bacterium]